MSGDGGCRPVGQCAFDEDFLLGKQLHLGMRRSVRLAAGGDRANFAPQCFPRARGLSIADVDLGTEWERFKKPAKHKYVHLRLRAAKRKNCSPRSNPYPIRSEADNSDTFFAHLLSNCCNPFVGGCAH